MPFKAASSYTFPPRLVLSIEGQPMTGKTHLIFSAPRPLYILSVDNGLEGMMTAEKFDLKRVFISDFSLSKPVSLIKEDAVARAIEVANQFKSELREKLQKEKRVTIAIDTESEFWQLFRLADLGKLDQVPPMRYAKVNRIYRGLMNEVFQTPHNLVLVHRVKDLYVDNKVVVGQFERDGFKEMDYIAQVAVRAWRTERKKDGPGGKKGSPLFGFTVIKCRQRASLIGKRYPGKKATFQQLALDVFPGSEEGDWT